MEVLAFSRPGDKIASREDYLELVQAAVSKRADLVVFPGLWAFYLAFCLGELGIQESFFSSRQAFLKLSREKSWPNNFLALQGFLARKLQAYLVSGSFEETGDRGRIYHSACLFSPEGDLLGCQRQTHLSREEHRWGFSRGEEVKVFAVNNARLGMIVGTDARYPEVGRILALQGADVICHCGALSGAAFREEQLAGVWSQVQQNQFFAVESQLQATIAERKFKGESAFHAPCEMTTEKNGYLARDEGKSIFVKSSLDYEARQQVINSYPLLKHLNFSAYRRHLTSLLGKTKKEKGENTCC